eukprot:176420_1
MAAAAQEFKLSNDQPLKCIVCDLSDTDEYKSKDDDLMICINSSCNKQYKVMCRGCMRNSHRRKNHTLQQDPRTFINIRATKFCTRCQVVHSRTNPNRNELFVCTKPRCGYRHHAMCSVCMTQTHNNLDHSPRNDTTNFVLLHQWYSLIKMNKIKPDSWAKTTCKVVVKREFFGAASVVGVLDKAGWKVIQQIPKNASYSQWTNGVLKAIEGSSTSAGALMKNMAKSQAFVNGLMFAGECGWYAFDYAYRGNGTWDEMVVKCQKAAKAHTCAFACSLILAGFGFLVAGPLGASVGGAVGGIIGDFGSRKYMNSADSQKYKEKQAKIQKALDTFDYQNETLSKLLKNKKKFNVDELKARYHLKAVWNHPDVLRRQGGYTDEEIKKKWSEFYSKYIILLDICKQRDNQ